MHRPTRRDFFWTPVPIFGPLGAHHGRGAVAVAVAVAVIVAVTRATTARQFFLK